MTPPSDAEAKLIEALNKIANREVRSLSDPCAEMILIARKALSDWVRNKQRTEK